VFFTPHKVLTMVYVMIVSILAAGVWSHIKMVAAQARSAYEAAHKQALAQLAAEQDSEVEQVAAAAATGEI
jgi:hypothetical protein